MFQVNTHLKVLFGDWLYILGYELKINDHSSEIVQPIHFFRKAKSLRFRFEKTAKPLPEEKLDLSFQYGNYHLSKLEFEDFKVASVGETQEAIKTLIQKEMSGKIAEGQMNTAICSIAKNLDWLLFDVNKVFILNVGDPTLEDKKAPFGMHILFCSLFAISKGGDKAVYLELGSD